MKIYLASDHAGFELKEHISSYLEENGFEVVDKGPHVFSKEDDYPDWISLAAEEVSMNPGGSVGIVIGHSGQGEAIVANKFKNVRAGVFYGGSSEVVKLLREHNNANVLSLGAHFVTSEQAIKAVETWLETQFSEEERHKRRIKKIHDIEIKK